MTIDEEIQKFGRSIQGVCKRIEKYEDLDDTQLCYYKYENSWYLYLPGCGLGNLSNHSVVENPDGTITVTPSILVTGHNKGTKIIRHGFLTNSVWRERVLINESSRYKS